MIIEIARIVKEVGAYILQWRDAELFDGVWDGPQYKAKVDQMAHEALVARLRDLTPGVQIISEEDASSLIEKRLEQYWIIDPIDGTASFATGYPGFVTQVAFVENSKPQLAAIYAPALDELYTAARGEGAYLNGRRLHIPARGVCRSLIDNYPAPKGVADALYKALGFKSYIECGSISLKICKVASGKADVFFKNVVIRDWDVAAPHLVLDEAGGFLADAQGNGFYYEGSYEHIGVVAANSYEVGRRVIDWYSDSIKGGRAE